MPAPGYGPNKKAYPGKRYWGIIVEKKGQKTDERGILETYIWSPFLQRGGGRLIIPRDVRSSESLFIGNYYEFQVSDNNEAIAVVGEKGYKNDNINPRLCTYQVTSRSFTVRLFVRFVVPSEDISCGPMANRTGYARKFWSPDLNAVFTHIDVQRKMEQSLQRVHPQCKLRYGLVYWGWVSYAGGDSGAIDFEGTDDGSLYKVHWQIDLAAVEDKGVYVADDQSKLLSCPLIPDEEKQQMYEDAQEFAMFLNDYKPLWNKDIAREGICFENSTNNTFSNFNPKNAGAFFSGSAGNTWQGNSTSATTWGNASNVKPNGVSSIGKQEDGWANNKREQRGVVGFGPPQSTRQPLPPPPSRPSRPPSTYRQSHPPPVRSGMGPSRSSILTDEWDREINDSSFRVSTDVPESSEYIEHRDNASRRQFVDHNNHQQQFNREPLGHVQLQGVRPQLFQVMEHEEIDSFVPSSTIQNSNVRSGITNNFRSAGEHNFGFGERSNSNFGSGTTNNFRSAGEDNFGFGEGSAVVPDHSIRDVIDQNSNFGSGTSSNFRSAGEDNFGFGEGSAVVPDNSMRNVIDQNSNFGSGITNNFRSAVEDNFGFGEGSAVVPDNSMRNVVIDQIADFPSFLPSQPSNVSTIHQRTSSHSNLRDAPTVRTTDRNRGFGMSNATTPAAPFTGFIQSPSNTVERLQRGFAEHQPRTSFDSMPQMMERALPAVNKYNPREAPSSLSSTTFHNQSQGFTSPLLPPLSSSSVHHTPPPPPPPPPPTLPRRLARGDPELTLLAARLREEERSSISGQRDESRVRGFGVSNSEQLVQRNGRTTPEFGRMKEVVSETRSFGSMKQNGMMRGFGAPPVMNDRVHGEERRREVRGMGSGWSDSDEPLPCFPGGGFMLQQLKKERAPLVPSIQEKERMKEEREVEKREEKKRMIRRLEENAERQETERKQREKLEGGFQHLRTNTVQTERPVSMRYSVPKPMVENQQRAVASTFNGQYQVGSNGRIFEMNGGMGEVRRPSALPSTTVTSTVPAIQRTIGKVQLPTPLNFGLYK